MKLLLYSLLCWLPASGFAYSAFQADGGPTPIRETVFYAKNGNPDWLVMKPGVQLSAEDLVRLHTRDMGLGEEDELRLFRTQTDQLGFTHYRYQQYHRGVKVEGGQLIVHEKDGFVRTLNGKLVRGLAASVSHGFPADAAIQRALAQAPAQRYMWESAGMEDLLRRVKNDATATYYPQPELVLVDPALEQDPANFQIAWRMIVHAQLPVSRKLMFVSARDGAVLRELEMLHTNNVEGTAETKYSGTRKIKTDSIGVGVFRLVETTRGGGIETYNCLTSFDQSEAVDFLDTDNHWNNVNPQQDEAATDAHWAAEMTYDYYWQKHQFASIDGNNYPLISYVHYGDNYANANWNGVSANIGDGDGIWSALSALDIVGHEFSHGLTEFSAGLIYNSESGALNESFSDVFGAAIEFFGSPEKADWLVGEDIDKFNRPLRNMADPKKEDNPDTYKGQHWVSGQQDNGGVHTNSGVQNHWFYLLTQGGTGINDRSNNYTVKGQGIDIAAAIAFRNLQYYLVEFSRYIDAREGALGAAEDLYGPCSEAFVENAKAWYAVGVGSELFVNELQSIRMLSPEPETCGLKSSEPVSVQFRYNGCNADLLPGTKIPIAYQIDKNPVVWDTINLTSVITSGDTFSFTFSKPTTLLSKAGKYQLTCWTALDGDSDVSNNYIEMLVDRIVDQNVDMGVARIVDLYSACDLGTQKPAMQIGYYGCNTLPAQTPITVYYRVDGGPVVTQGIQTPTPLNRNETFKHTFSTPANLTTKGVHFVDAWVKYGPDFLSANDTLKGFPVMNAVDMHKYDIITFEAANASLDSFFTTPGIEVQAKISPNAARTGAFGFEVTGGNVKQAIEENNFEQPNKDNVWEAGFNEDFRSQLCVCADLTNQTQAELRFDKRMTYSKFYIKALTKNLPYASSLRVLANNEQISTTYKPVTYANDAWATHKFNLAPYLGGFVEICFETHTGLSQALDTTGVGDRVLLDNITIVGTVGTGEQFIQTPEWKITPNPGTGRFNLSYQAPEAGELAIEVVDAVGHIVHTQRRAVGSGETQIPLNLESAAPGMYLLRLGMGQVKAVTKLIIQR